MHVVKEKKCHLDLYASLNKADRCTYAYYLQQGGHLFSNTISGLLAARVRTGYPKPRDRSPTRPFPHSTCTSSPLAINTPVKNRWLRNPLQSGSPLLPRPG
ncbi:hypothetical protein VaNZ11_011098 [Volvox africanus]|uniref:Uncharacterized protein n=1 Tax=Volvox africanus TaxID=51714 RepID=A0ABQ5SAT3_9CHLO|nr:hypothetical protein VaNZ11_011098 [Volvox africanus]